jgi:hypothetical protein
MAKFRSTDNPNVTVEFTAENDIAEMRRHPQYVEVVEEVKAAENLRVAKNAKREA